MWTNYCKVTFSDALDTPVDQIDREIEAINEYLRNHNLIPHDQLMTLVRERRAWVMGKQIHRIPI